MSSLLQPVSELTVPNNALSKQDLTYFWFSLLYLGLIIFCTPFLHFIPPFRKFIIALGLIGIASEAGVPRLAISIFNGLINGSEDYYNWCSYDIEITKESIMAIESPNPPPRGTHPGPLFPPKEMLNHLWTRNGELNTEDLYLVMAYMGFSVLCNFGVFSLEITYRILFFELSKLQEFSTLREDIQVLYTVLYNLNADPEVLYLCVQYKNYIVEQFKNNIEQKNSPE